MSDLPLAPELLTRIDDSTDSHFYALARLVNHIDDATISQLSAYYGEVLAANGAVLDLMSSWVSHLPDTSYSRVAGLGMNKAELQANPRLSEHVVHDLNTNPELPYPDASFDAVINAVSIQYLIHPVEVFTSIQKVLKPGGISIVAMSHRCFPTKAIQAFHYMSGPERQVLVSHYHALAGGFDTAELIDRSPPNADPLWIVTAKRSPDPTA
jgi:SAM-dependent methyltransferase